MLTIGRFWHIPPVFREIEDKKTPVALWAKPALGSQQRRQYTLLPDVHALRALT